MARNKKVEILSNDKEVLHPMTDGDCVIFEDGQTLTQKLSEDDSVKYTPEIVNSSPMFKVGEGNTVDYSDNVLDGAYERATLQGQTYVNYIQESSADEVTLPTPFTEYERTQHNTLTSDEEGTLGINLVGQSYVNALQHDSEEEYVVLGESLEFQEKKVGYTNEGQIKSAMLKGQTLVNLGQPQIGLHNNDYGYQGNASACVDYGEYIRYIPNGVNNLCPCIRLHIKSEVDGNYFSTKQPLKTNTKYIVFVKLNVQSATVSKLRVSTTGYNNAGEVGSVVLSQGLQVAKAIFTTPTEFTDHLCVGTDLYWEQGQYVDLYWYQLFEYQEGMENWDIPYFEGMQSVTVSTKLENKLGTCTVGSIAQYAKNGKTFTTTDASTRQCTLYSTTQAATNPANLKPNTEYIIGFQISNLVLDGLSSIDLTFSSGTIDSGNCLFTSVTGGDSKIAITSNGTYRIRRKTTDLITSSLAVIKGFSGQWENSGSTLRSLTISNIMYVEYQNGMENWTLPYFEDYQVMKPVQVESVNKNIIDFYDYTETKYGTTNTIKNGVFTITGTSNRSGGRNNFYGYSTVLKAGKTYTFSIHDLVETGSKVPGFYMSNSETGIALLSVGSVHENGTIRDSQVIALAQDTLVHIWNNTLEGETYNTTCRLMLEESDTVTSYAPHQSKTTYSWDEVILRKVGDVEDTLDLTTGEWIQRIGEIVLDGSQTFSTNDGYTNEEYWCGWTHAVSNRKINIYFALCDKLTVSGSVDGEECLMLEYDTTAIYLKIKKEKGVTDLSTLYEYLSRNPITVQYQLATPIVHKVNLSRPNLQVYDDITHVHTKCLDGTLIPNIYLPSDISYPAILEPGKAYNVSINHTQVNADNPLTVNVGGTEITMTDSRMTLNTPATLANSNVSFTGKGNKIKESMLIKNSSLLTRDLPHFNGIGSVQLGKTIENLCSASGFKAGDSHATITWYDSYAHTKISNKAGSCVFVFNLIKPLKNGKKYFVYAPHTLAGDSGRVSFRKVHNGTLTYSMQQTLLPKDGKCIIEIDQQDNPHTHICVGCHHSITLGTEFDVYRPIICEYEPGMENWDWESIGYFTGTKNIGNEFMRVQNKNLFDGTIQNHYWNAPFTNGSFAIWKQSYDRIASTHKIPVSKGKTYRISGTNIIREIVTFFKTTSTSELPFDARQGLQFTSPYNGYIEWYLSNDNVNNPVSNIQIEESSTATTYTAHKHNGLYITKDQPIELTWEQGRINPSGVGDSYTNAINNAVSYGIRNKGLLNLKPNTTYRISLGDKTNFKYHIAAFDNWDNALASSSLPGIGGDWVSSRDTIFTTTKDVHKIGINIQKQDASSITPPESVHVQVRLEEVTDVVLRSCTGKHDELDLTRGIYIQKVGMVYVDGVNQHSNYITVVGDSYQPTDTTLKTFDIRCDGVVVDSICLSNRFPMRESMESTAINFESVRIHSTNTSCRLTIKKEKASTVEEFKLWLQDNPLEIIYALKTPIIHKVHIGNKNEANTEVTKPNDVFTLPTLYTEQTHIDLTNNGIMPKVQSRDYIAYPVLPMVSRTYTLQHNLTGGVSNLTVDLLGRTQEITYQEPKSLIYSPETMDAKLHNELRISGKGKINRVMYIDGGYMDRDIPFIEGMKNAVNPIVKNVGRNLFDKTSTKYIGSWLSSSCAINKLDRIKLYYIPCLPNTTYTISKVLSKYFRAGTTNEIPTTSSTLLQVVIKDSSSEVLQITTVGSAKYLCFNVYDNSQDTLTEQQILDTVMLTQGAQNIQYELYKENICYVDCGEIRLTPDMFEQGSVNNTGDSYESDKNTAKTRIRTKELIELEPGVQYVILGNDSMYKYSAHFFDKDGMQVKGSYDLSWKGNKPFTAPSDAPMTAFFVAYQDNRNFTVDDADFNFQLVKVSEIKQLRSLPNGVHDEIDLETGKYIQRVGEITFNGTENWTVGYSSWDNKRTYYNYDFIDLKTFKGDNGSGQAYYDAVRCPQLHRSYMSRLASALIDGVCSYYYSGYQRIFISKQDCATVNELKLWLQENPITVQYELPEPIVKDIVIHNYPHSYEDGHVVVENGNSSTPIPAQLTYRAVTNRSGQIQQHTEQVEKQEKEINELETLILANIHLSQTR